MNQLAKLFTSVTILSVSTISPVLANPIPNNLKVPQQIMLLSAQAKGVQIYTCKVKKKTANQYEWTLEAPEAVLFNSKNGNQIGKHYGGPTWEASDGSKVVGEVKTRANAPNKNNIPWLLLATKSRAGNGIFSQVNYIQRVDTIGGKAPTSGCDSNRVNAETRVNYTAIYYFYGAAR